MPTKMKHVIHTSERKDFKRCRQLWDFRSPNRLSFEPKRIQWALNFGTAVHAGLEVYYDPETWNVDRGGVQALALIAFIKAMPVLPDDASDDEIAEWDQYAALGKGMLNHYFEYALKNDKFVPRFAEIKFEVPLFDLFEDVFYGGRIDAIVEDESGGLWILDHKTASKFDPEEFLVMDEQVTSYCWAIQQILGIKIEGFIYNELRKDVPHPPKVLQNGMLSKDKSQNTTFDLYLTAIHERGHSVGLYADILNHLQNQGNKFFRRTYVRRSPRELQLAGERIALEAADMLGNPSIYPNPDRHCTYCAFRAPCLARMDGSDDGWILEGNFTKKENEDLA